MRFQEKHEIKREAGVGAVEVWRQNRGEKQSNSKNFLMKIKT
jgi:hypothetical protein